MIGLYSRPGCSFLVSFLGSRKKHHEWLCLAFSHSRCQHILTMDDLFADHGSSGTILQRFAQREIISTTSLEEALRFKSDIPAAGASNEDLNNRIRSTWYHTGGGVHAQRSLIWIRPCWCCLLYAMTSMTCQKADGCLQFLRFASADVKKLKPSESIVTPTQLF